METPLHESIDDDVDEKRSLPDTSLQIRHSSSLGDIPKHDDVDEEQIYRRVHRSGGISRGAANMLGCWDPVNNRLRCWGFIVQNIVCMAVLFFCMTLVATQWNILPEPVVMFCLSTITFILGYYCDRPDPYK